MDKMLKQFTGHDANTAPSKVEVARTIKARMALKGLTCSEIAERESVDKSYVSLVVHGRRRGQRIRRTIAAALQVKISDLWPDVHKQTA